MVTNIEKEKFTESKYWYWYDLLCDKCNKYIYRFSTLITPEEFSKNPCYCDNCYKELFKERRNEEERN